jgi:hypothetical protein
MSRRTLVCLMIVVFALTLPGAAARAAKDNPSAAELMPDSMVAYVEINRPAELIDRVMDHPLRKQLEQLPDYRKAVDGPDFKQFLDVVGLVENRAGVQWRPALETITGGGVAIGLDIKSQGVVMLVKPQDAATATSVREAVFGLAREDAKSKGQPNPIKTKDYRGLTAYEVGETWISNFGPWLMLTNKTDLAKTMADQFLDGGANLAAGKEFASARATAIAREGDAPVAWGFVRLAPLREMGLAKELLNPQEKSDNPGIELLFGGLLSTLKNTPFLTSTLNVDRDGLKLSFSAPHDPAWVPAERKFYFGPADAPLRPTGTVLSVTTYRDLPGLWKAAPDLFNEGVAAQLAKADSDLSMFLGGKSFGADILGSIEPQIQWVTARQDYHAAGVPEPTIRLPSSALVVRIKAGAAKTVQRPFKLAFQSGVALANVNAAMTGRPMLEMKNETRGPSEILYGAYEPPDAKPANGSKDKAKGADPDDPKKAGDKKPEDDIYYNITPALVMSDDYLMLCTTRQIAEELADLAAKQGHGKIGAIAENTRIEADGIIAAELLRLNREQLVSQNMLEKGHDRAAAEKEVDSLLTLVDFIRNATIRLFPNDKTVRLEVELKTNGG